MNFNNDNESGQTTAEQGGMNTQQSQQSGGSQAAQESRAASQRDVQAVDKKAESVKRYAIEEVEALREQVSELREENRALAAALIDVDEGLAEAFEHVKTAKVGQRINWEPEAEGGETCPDVEGERSEE